MRWYCRLTQRPQHVAERHNATHAHHTTHIIWQFPVTLVTHRLSTNHQGNFLCALQGACKLCMRLARRMKFLMRLARRMQFVMRLARRIKQLHAPCKAHEKLTLPTPSLVAVPGYPLLSTCCRTKPGNCQLVGRGVGGWARQLHTMTHNGKLTRTSLCGNSAYINLVTR